MSGEIAVFLAYSVGFFIIFFFGRLLLVPLKWLLRLAVNSIIGAGFIAAVNILGSGVGLSVPLNILNALIVGLLGLPGAVMLFVLTNL